MFFWKLLLRLMFCAFMALLGAAAYSFLVICADWLQAFLAGQIYKFRLGDFPWSVTAFVGSLMGLTIASPLVAIYEGDYEGAAKTCFSIGIISIWAAFSIGVIMLLVSSRYGWGIAIRDFLIFFLGWGSPLAFGSALLLFRSYARFR
jgi:hypothetical protein